MNASTSLEALGAAATEEEENLIPTIAWPFIISGEGSAIIDKYIKVMISYQVNINLRPLGRWIGVGMD